MMQESTEMYTHTEELHALPIEGGAIKLHGILHVPNNAHGLVMLARGITQEEDSIQQRALAQTQPFHKARLATLVVDLFTGEERRIDRESGYFAQNIEVLQQRLIGVAEWLALQPATEKLSIGIFGVGVVGSAALIAAAERPDTILAVVAAGNSIAPAREALPRLTVPTMLIAAGQDSATVQTAQAAIESIKGEKRFEQVEGVNNLFANDEAIKTLLGLARDWFAQKLVTIPAAGEFEL